MAKSRRARNAAKSKRRTKNKVSGFKGKEGTPKKAELDSIVAPGNDTAPSGTTTSHRFQVDNADSAAKALPVESAARQRTVTSDSARTYQSNVSGASRGTAQTATSTSSTSDMTLASLWDPTSLTEDVVRIAKFDQEDRTHDASAIKDKESTTSSSIDPYDPSMYRCTGYETKGYVWFDGGSDAVDSRFIIDLENGTMDRLPDVRPYLYHVGYCAGDRIDDSQGKQDASRVEDHYVRAGRQYLIKERGRGLGYFLAYRDWSDSYDGKMPFQEALHFEGELPEDVGLQGEHSGDAEDCVEGSIIKTNLRPPLPDISVAKVLPGDVRWDLFIQWLYTCQIHPLVGFLDCHYDEAMVQQERHLNGSMFGTFLADSDFYD